MSTISETLSPFRALGWFLAASLGGIAWNIFGVVQFAGSIVATEESLVVSRLTADQASVMTGYPGWVTLAFARGAFGGLAGSVLLLLRLSIAKPVLAISLAAYCALWIGDALDGVFTAMGMLQIVILTTVVAIAAALFVLSHHPAATA